MATVEQAFIREQLEQRRQRLEAAVAVGREDATLAQLLREVDAALERVARGTYGICEECHEPIDKNRLLADPLIRYCLDHLTSAQRRALEQDLELAARIQRGLLPPQGLRWNGWEAHFHYQAAGPVSGDYCDMIRPEGGAEMFFVLGDVSGKGVAASMLMSQLHAMFRTLTSLSIPLDQLMNRANRIFCENMLGGQFATLVCGRAKGRGEVEICNAGHLPVLRVGRNGIEKIESGGLPLGMFCEREYTFQRIRLEPKESLLLYTDGVSETCNPTGTEYGVEQLAKLAHEQNGLAAQALVLACLEDLRKFANGSAPADDLAILVLRRAE